MLLRAVLILSAAALAAPTLAQVTPAQREVLRACRLDLAAYCSGVQPGGGRIGVCIRDNWAKLAPACQQTILDQQRAGAGAATPPEPPAPAPGGEPEASTHARNAVRQACAMDLRQYCSDLQPGGAIRQCMTENFQRFSTACRRTLTALRPAGAPAPSSSPAP